jgi:Viral BACON domain
MNKFIYTLCCLLLSFGVATAQLTVSPSNIALNPLGETQAAIITSGDTSTWSISGMPTWATATPLVGGQGLTTVAITAPANTGLTTRFGTLIVSNSTRRIYIYISQQGNVANCTDPAEPNNSRSAAYDLGSLTAANPLSLSGLCLSPARDTDFFKFSLNNRQYYARIRGFSTSTIGTYGISANLDTADILQIRTFSTVPGTNTDTYLTLYDANGNVLIENDDFGGTFYSQIRYNYVNPVSLSVSTQQLSFTGTGIQTFLVTSQNTNWTVTGVPAWLTVSPSSGGNGVTTVSVTPLANTNTFTRSAYMVVSGSGRSFGIMVSQTGTAVVLNCTDANEPNNSSATSTNLGAIVGSRIDSALCLSPSGDLDFYRFSVNGVNYSAQVKGFTASTTGRYGLRIRVDSSILTLTTFTTDGNNTDTYLYLYNAAGTQLAFNDDFGGSFFSQIIYNTDPSTSSLVVTPMVLNVFGAVGGVQSLSVVSSNVAWTITGQPSWVSVSPTVGANGTSYVTVNASTNADSLSRSGFIVVSGGGRTVSVPILQLGNPNYTPCTDTYEPNNTQAQATNIGSIGGSGTVSFGNVCLTRGDFDFYRFQVDSFTYYIKVNGFNTSSVTYPNVGPYGLRINRAGMVLTISTFGTSSTNVDTYLTLFDANGVQLAVNDDFGGTFYSQIIFTAGSVVVNPVTSVSPSNVVFGNGLSATQYITITTATTNTWTVGQLPSWLTVSRNTGTGSGNFLLSGGAMTDTMPRFATFNVTVAGVNYVITVTQNPAVVVPVPVNDEICGAINLVASANPNCLATTSFGATTSISIPVSAICASGSTYPPLDVWYKTTVPASGVVTIRTTSGTMTDAIMTLYTADSSNCNNLNNLVALACEDDNNNGNRSLMPVLTARAASGTRVYVRVWGFSQQRGTFNICALDYDTVNIRGGGNPISSVRRLNVYPNPASSQVTVEYFGTGMTSEEPSVINVFDLLGRTVVSQTVGIGSGKNIYSLK